MNPDQDASVDTRESNRPSGWKLAVPLIMFLALVLLLWRGLYNDPSLLPAVRVNQPLPEMSLAVLGKDEQISTRSLVGKPFLLNVWATWCPTCYAEHAYLVELAQKKNVRIVGVNYKEDDRPLAMKLLAERGNPYEVVLEDLQGRFGIELGVYGAPETYIIAADGTILHRRVGDMNERVWQDEILPVLQANGIAW